MKDELEPREVCAICGTDANGDRWFCHFYHEPAPVTLCSPVCAQVFLRRPSGIGATSRVSTNGSGQHRRAEPMPLGR